MNKAIHAAVLMRALVLVLALSACAGDTAKQPPADAGAFSGRRTSVVETAHSLSSGTRVDATLQDALSSRTNSAGDTLHAIVSHDIKDGRGRVVIPAGANVTLTIGELESGSEHVHPAGRLSLTATAVLIEGREQPLTAELEPVAHHMEGRDATTAAAEARPAVRDVVVSAGTPIVFTLSNTLNVTTR